MSRKLPKREWCVRNMTDGAAEYRGYPSAVARRHWYYMEMMGRSKTPGGFVYQHQDEARFLLHYIRRGEMWHTVANRTHRAPAGSVCLMYLQKPVRYGVDPDKKAETWWIVFGGRDLPEIFLELAADRDPVFVLPDVRRFERQFQELVTLAYQRSVGYQARSFAVLAAMLAELFVARGIHDEMEITLIHRAGTQLSSLSEPVLNGIRAIARHYHEATDLKGIAQSAGLSIYHCVRLFHRETGMTPVHYLTSYRMEKAKELLLTTHHPMREIARMVGIPDPNTFTRTFRKTVGHPPSEHREKSSK